MRVHFVIQSVHTVCGPWHFFDKVCWSSIAGLAQMSVSSASHVGIDCSFNEVSAYLVHGLAARDEPEKHF